MKLQEILKQLILEKGVNVSDVVRETGLSPTPIYAILKGEAKRPLSSTIKKLADYFGVTPKYLLTGEKGGDDALLDARVAAEVQKQLKAAGPSLNKIVLNDYQKELIEKKYFEGNGFLKVYTRMKNMTPEVKEVLYRLLWGIDEVLRRENYRNEGAGKP